MSKFVLELIGESEAKLVGYPTLEKGMTGFTDAINSREYNHVKLMEEGRLVKIYMKKPYTYYYTVRYDYDDKDFDDMEDAERFYQHTIESDLCFHVGLMEVRVDPYLDMSVEWNEGIILKSWTR